MSSHAVRTLDDLGAIAGKRILVRVDFNVPVDDAGQITDDTRIQGALPTIRELVQAGGRVILMSHRGRPKGWGGASLDVVANRLAELLGTKVAFVDDVVGEAAGKAVADLSAGQVLLLQNLRYEAGEKAGDRLFAQKLARLGDVYVNDAFGTAHRADASVALVPEILPGYAGRLLMRELEVLGHLVTDAAHPYWAIIGGSKVSDKVSLLGALLTKVDGLIVGGGMANTFLSAQGYDMGASRVEPDAVNLARDLLSRAHERKITVVLPREVVAAQGFREDAPARVAAPGTLRADEMALDVAASSVDEMLQQVHNAKTIFWNGPLGVFEWERFQEGTMRMAHGLAELSAEVVVGGGDSVAAVRRAGVSDRLAHISTGGGAALELLEGKTLPGVAALMTSPKE
ncbi:MAG: phosphoglycerate kinase [Sulfobacillus acidophilus]|uniref:Phosphoglycerate kinase n=1 Tax=Sulfobacillus acidophilus TaxID=53633 RepID=A0A2T2WJ84_9FIRM|nr:MAG: phosphoglycerate kinase [Sulfobacillus acidophilus]